jgi:hypothetical protein
MERAWRRRVRRIHAGCAGAACGKFLLPRGTERQDVAEAEVKGGEGASSSRFHPILLWIGGFGESGTSCRRRSGAWGKHSSRCALQAGVELDAALSGVARGFLTFSLSLNIEVMRKHSKQGSRGKNLWDLFFPCCCFKRGNAIKAQKIQKKRQIRKITDRFLTAPWGILNARNRMYLDCRSCLDSACCSSRALLVRTYRRSSPYWQSLTS